MVVGEIPEAVDFLVVGAGPGGYAAALHAAYLGRQVTLVDRRGDAGLGGVCLHSGCLPGQALRELADRVDGVRTFAQAGLRVPELDVDLAAFQEWKGGIVERLRKGVGDLLAAAGVRVVAGTCRFTRPSQAVVQTPDDRAVFLEFTDALLATGSRSTVPPELALDGESVIDGASALNLDRVPGSLLVVGAGPVGVELGTAFAKLGSAVTVVEQAGQVLPDLDAAIVRPLRQRFRQLSMEVVTEAGLVDREAGEAQIKTPAGERRVPAEVVLVATGRQPNTDELGLAEAGITVRTDGLLEPAPDGRLSPHIAAVGDLTPGRAVAHRASAEARVAAEALCGRAVAFAPQAVPFVVYADPPIATAGLTEGEARAEGVDVRTATFPLGASGRAATLGRREGRAELVVDADTDAIVGVHLVGTGAAELIAEGALAIEMGATVEDLSLTVHPHPTLSEQLVEAAHLATGMPFNVPRPAGG
jgi:dihydrolipoamide dehydrogenase